MFNFLASQHRVLPEGAACDEEEDEVQLRSTRYGGKELGLRLGDWDLEPLADAFSCPRRATSLELPMAMRFRHLKKTSKEAVGVYR